MDDYIEDAPSTCDVSKGLKISELKEGCIYRCLLSNRKVLVYQVTTTSVEGFPDAVGVMGHSYSDVAGYYDCVTPFDYQLALI